MLYAHIYNKSTYTKYDDKIYLRIKIFICENSKDVIIHSTFQELNVIDMLFGLLEVTYIDTHFKHILTIQQ